ncbi:MAG: hypothetical protein ACXVBX_10210, partial [Flavisolibacter sp.]
TIVNKENKEYKLQGKFDFYYTFVPDFAAGWTPPMTAPGWVRGGSFGEMNHLGKCESYFVQYNYVVSTNPFTIKGRTASLNMFYADSLKAKLGPNFNVSPEAATVVFDMQGNSISSKVDQNGLTYQQVNDTLLTFRARYEIIGGTGKFANAKGWFINEGYVDPRLPIVNNKLGYQFNNVSIIKDGVLKF